MPKIALFSPPATVHLMIFRRPFDVFDIQACFFQVCRHSRNSARNFVFQRENDPDTTSIEDDADDDDSGRDGDLINKDHEHVTAASVTARPPSFIDALAIICHLDYK